MEVSRRTKLQTQIQDENIHAHRPKSAMVFPSKRQGLGLRGALGEVNSNIQVSRETTISKGQCITECDKKGLLNRQVSKSNTYRHVQSKIDTGLAVAKPASRPPLRREESTANLANKAIKSKMALKEIQNIKTSEVKESKLLAKKEIKKIIKVPSIKEKSSDSKTLKKVSKDTEALEKLTLELNISKEEPSLPADIEDIDAKDNNCPLLMSMYIKDIYKYLLELEDKYPIEKDHLKNQSSITGRMRATLIDWLVEVQRQFALVLETFHLTVGIIDRYLQVVPNVQRSQLQLLGVTAMFIASKYEEIYPPDIADFVYITDNAYSKREVLACEREVMAKLGFCLGRPIPLHFLRRFIKAAHGTAKNHHLAKYFVDLSLVDYSMAHYRPSELAAASICLSLHLLSSEKLEKVWTPTLSYYSGYTLEHIQPIIESIAAIIINVSNSKFKAVFNKYLDTSLARVSGLPQLKGPAIHELAKSEIDQ